MLYAVFSGKKRGSGLQSQQPALELAEGAEDVLTAGVFERLAYLPDGLLTAVLSELLGEATRQWLGHWRVWRVMPQT